MVAHWLGEMSGRGRISIRTFDTLTCFLYCKTYNLVSRENLRHSTRMWMEHEFKSQGSLLVVGSLADPLISL